MSKPIIRIHDTETDEVIDREMTDAEYEAHLASQEKDKLRKAEEDAKEASKKAILDRLGLTTEELNTILGL